MKLQGASVLDLVTELLIRLDAGTPETKAVLAREGAALARILDGCGFDGLDCFERMRMSPLLEEAKNAGDDRLQPQRGSKHHRR